MRPAVDVIRDALWTHRHLALIAQAEETVKALQAAGYTIAAREAIKILAEEALAHKERANHTEDSQ